MYNFLLLCLLFYCSHLFAASNETFSTWDSLRTIPQGEKIKIRGFLYQTDDHRWVLSPDPDLKTCCIGARHKKDSQIFVEGKFTVNPHHVINLEGIFLRNAHTGNYQLIQPHETIGLSSKFPWLTVCIGCIMLVFCIFFWCYRIR